MMSPTGAAHPRTDKAETLFGSLREQLDFYRAEIQFESSMLSNRTNVYLSSQSFLMIAFASSMSNTNSQWGTQFTLYVPTLLALLGLVTSIHAWPGIKAAFDVIEHWHRKQCELLDTLNEPCVTRVTPLYGAGNEPLNGSRYRKSLLFSLRSPLIFSVVWAFLGVLAVSLHLLYG